MYNLVLTCRTSYYDSCNFITRMIFSDAYWLYVLFYCILSCVVCYRGNAVCHCFNKPLSIYLSIYLLAKRCVPVQKLLLTAYTIGSRIEGIDWYQSDVTWSWKIKLVTTYSSTRSSKVIDLGVNRKRICDFLFVINTKAYLLPFRDIDV